MKQLNYTIVNRLLTTLFGIVVYLFFSTFYSSHLHYQEQYQLFLYDSHYWEECITSPAGLASYVGEFITQFFYHSWLGALLLALLLIAVQQLVWAIAKTFGNKPLFYPLTFLPSLLVWAFLCDENSLISCLVALLITLATTWSFLRFKTNSLKMVVATLLVPLLYWYLGGLALLFTLVSSLQLYLMSRDKGNKWALLSPFSLLFLAILTPCILQKWMHYPLSNLFIGIGYYRYPSITPPILWAIFTFSILIPISFKWLPTPPTKQQTVVSILQLVGLILTATLLVSYNIQMEREEEMRYDYLVRQGEWERIIRKATGKIPTTPLSVGCVNLALAMRGQLAEGMFHFYQNGVEGLLRTFQRDYRSPLTTSEAYYQLGMINTAQRFTFEAMEAIPNHKKSSRCYKRLAETNLINGDYKVARKYINALSKTLFYKEWAANSARYLYNEEMIENHSTWGWLRKAKYKEDFLFADGEVDTMLGMLIQHNKQNSLALQYMMGYLLLQKEVGQFMNYLPLVRHFNYTTLPRSYQEALAYGWFEQYHSFEGVPKAVSPQIIKGLESFRLHYQKAPGLLNQEPYRSSYWYYLLK